MDFPRAINYFVVGDLAADGVLGSAFAPGYASDRPLRHLTWDPYCRQWWRHIPLSCTSYDIEIGGNFIAAPSAMAYGLPLEQLQCARYARTHTPAWLQHRYAMPAAHNFPCTSCMVV